MIRLNPGQKALDSGQYSAFDRNGNRIPRRQVTMVVGKRLPPVRGHAGAFYVLTDETRHISS